jgi:hypothetical protein
MPDLNISRHVARQYRASLAMLGQAIDVCPESLWQSPEYPNRYWHIAYHALFYTYFYLQPGESDFRAWVKHRRGHQYLAAFPGSREEKPKILTPYTKSELVEFHELCRNDVEARVPLLDLAAASGFSWLPFNKLELQFYNIRHIQHHTGQLADRLRTAANIGVEWVIPE